MSKDGTQAKGWHDDFASDSPEHARRQSGELKYDATIIYDDGARRETEPDTRQADMVSREKVIEELEAARDGSMCAAEASGTRLSKAVITTVVTPMLTTLIERVRKL